MCRITRLQLQTDFLFRGAAVFPSWFSDYRMEICRQLYTETFTVKLSSDLITEYIFTLVELSRIV